MNTLRGIGGAVARVFKRIGYLSRAALGAVLLGVIETFTSERGRRLLALGVLVGLGALMFFHSPVRAVDTDVVAVRVNRWSGQAAHVPAGWVVTVPLVHTLRTVPAGDVVYRPAGGQAVRYQSVEGLSIGVDVAVRYAVDASDAQAVARGLPQAWMVDPIISSVLHRTLARHTVREIFSSKRSDIEAAVEAELRPLLAADGVRLRSVMFGTIDLPAEYAKGLEAVLTEELASEKMRYTLELQAKRIEEAELVASADKVRREKEAEAAAQEELIAARGRAEAMKHILPFKEREIEQKRLEAEASRVSRLKLAEAEADARRIEAGGEADYRRKLAESEAYRLEVTGKVQSEQLARDGAVISRNPLLIQKTIADKLSDKVQVIIAPPGTNGFFAEGLVGRLPEPAPVEE